MKQKYTLMLFTESYPYKAAAEGSFLAWELEHLCNTFDKVVIVPSYLSGEKYLVSCKVHVDETFAKREHKTSLEKLKKYIPVLLSGLFWDDVVSKGFLLSNPDAMKRLFIFVGNALKTYTYVCSLIKEDMIGLKNTLFYSYWLNWYCLGIGLAKAKYPSMKLVSRTHGVDLYENRFAPPYIPCRARTLKMLDYLFLSSEQARTYIVEQYPFMNSKSEVFHLGVRDPGFLSKPSTDGIFRVFSCSYMVPVKRIDLLIRGLKILAERVSGKVIEWHHIGDGILRGVIEKTVKSFNLPNLRCSFYGNLENEVVYEIYKNTPVDVFINVSASEGGVPVSISEALSCGIPVVATAVGGNNESVSMENGMLISPNPSHEEIAMALKQIMEGANDFGRRKNSKKLWQKKFNADINFSSFAQRILSFASERC